MQVTERQIRNAIKEILDEADEEYGHRDETKKTFGECGAATSNHWTAYGLEYAAEIICSKLLKRDYMFRNGRRGFHSIRDYTEVKK